MPPVLQTGGILAVVFALFTWLVPIAVLTLAVYELSQTAEYNRQTVLALGRIDARLESVQHRESSNGKREGSEVRSESSEE